MPTLDWLNRDAAFRTAQQVPTRVLRPHASLGDAGPVVGEPAAAAGNLLVQGDNLDALKALLPFYRGQVKCIFIDPPYNTRSAFEHYDDNLEHAQWLGMMLPRLQLLREFLRADGSIWVTIDDNEGHYLKVLMDEVFGRGNFITSVCWEKVYTLKNTARHFSEQHDLVFVYAKARETFAMNHLPRGEKQNAQFSNRDNDARGPWLDSAVHARNFYSKGSYAVRSPGGKVFEPPPGRYWTVSEDNFWALHADDRIWWGKDGNNAPRKKAFLSEVKASVVPGTIWRYDEVGENAEAKSEIKQLFAAQAEIFITPKPERLIQRILHIASNPGDLVLDSFLGSGTTAAVAHKMGRRWIGIEAGEHAVTHCLPRLRKVVEGEPGGISASVGWQGGGGFQFMALGEPLFDAQGDLHPEVRFADLARFIWLRETGTALQHVVPGTPLLGVHQGVGHYLLFNGVLGDKRPAGGNVLNTPVLDALHQTCWHAGPKLVYGEACRLGEARLAQEGITFKQLPHAVPR